MQKAWNYSKGLFSLEQSPVGWLVHFFNGVEGIKEDTNNRCRICTHLATQQFISLGARPKIHFREQQACESGYMAADFCDSAITATIHTLTGASHNEKFP